MNNVPALFVRLSTGILAIVIMVCAVQADTVIQVNLNGSVNGIFGDQVSSYQVQLFDSQTPITVANFLNYANANAYNGTIFHRDVPNFIIQGGGFKLQVDANNLVTAINPIATNPPIQNEFSPSRSNLRGTIAMAKLGNDPNSATSQWFVNLANNSANLDNQNGGFTVFGHVAGEGMTLIDAAAALPTYNLNPQYFPSDPQNGPFSDVPLANASIFITVLNTNVISTVAWKGGTAPAPTDWGTLANWGSGSSVPDGIGVNVDIGSQASANNVIDMISAGRTVGNIYYTPFSSTTIQSTGGKSLTLDNNGKTALVNVLGNHTISASMILNNNTIFSVNGTLAISGGISGTGSLAVSDTGRLTLTGANTYGGNTLITDGSLVAAQAASLPGYNTSGKVTVSSGAALIIRAGASTGEWAESEISALQSNAVFDSGSFLVIDTSIGSFTYGGTLGGSLDFAKLGNKTLLLTGSNTYSGNTEVVAGTLTAGKAASLPGFNASGKVSVLQGATLAVRAGAASGEWAAADIDALRTNVTFNSGSFLGIDTTGGDFTYGSTMGGSLGFAKQGNNTLLLTGSNTYSGKTEVVTGTLTAGKAASLPGYNASGKISVDSGATLAVRAGAATGEWAVSEINTLRTNVTFNSGSLLGIDTTGGNFAYGSVIGGTQGLNKLGINTLTLTAINTFTGPTVINAGTLQLASGGTLPSTTAVNLTASGTKLDANGISQTIASLSGVAGSEVMLGGSTLTTGDNTSTTFAGEITSTSGGSLTKRGSGMFTLSASPDYKGPTVISAGTLQFASGAALPSTTAVNLTASGAKLDANGISQTIASLSGVADSEVMLGGSTLTAGGDNTSTTFAGAITSTSGGSLTKTGSGTFTLTGANTFSGAVNFNAGLIKAASLSNLGNAAALNFNGGGLQFDGGFDPSPRTMTFLAGGAILDTQTNNIIMANSIGNGGAGGLTKNGPAILTLSISPNYGGATVINAGTLALASGATLPSTTAVSLVANGATLNINGNSQTIASLTGLTGTEVKLGGGALTAGDGSSTTFAGAITSTSSGSLTKTGSGTFTLTGSNTFSGAVNFNAGLIKAASLSNLGNAAALNFNGGGLQFDAGFDPSLDNRTITFQALGATLDTQANNVTVSKAIGNAGAGGLSKSGSGILELDGAVSYSGGTTINAGVLKFNNKQSTTLSAISGAGNLEVDGANTVLTASSINVNTLTVGAGSVVVIAPISGGPHIVQESSIRPIPEPNILVLLGIAALATLFAARRGRS